MKKITITILSLFALTVVNAQTAVRMTLVEEFTQASCGPCASQNPAFNTLLDANIPPSANKAIAIKYQTDWPGVDPMNVHNASQVDTRVTYYGVTGVPDATLDGVELTGSSYTGAPANFTQAKIDTRQAIMSYFTIALSHTLNAAHDSIFLTATITPNSTVPAGTYVTHLVVMERDVEFCKAPGTNGETEFYGVMKRMLPSDAGTAVSSLVSPTTINASWKLANVYDHSQLATVAFIQNVTSKEVMQAAYSAPVPLANLANTTCPSVLPVFTCATTVNPTITLDNVGTASLTSATISYQVDGGAIQTQPWTGSLASGSSVVVNMPALSTSAGSHTYKTWVSAPAHAGLSNGTMDNFAIGASTGGAAPVTQAFSSTTFPPSNWYLIDPDHVARPWQRSSSAGANSTTSSSYIFINWNTAGSMCDLQMPSVNLSSQTGVVGLTFWLAAASIDGSQNDELQVVASTDCGANWTVKYTKTGAALYTAAPNSSSLIAPAAADWRGEFVDLSSYIGQSNVLVRFRAISDNGNSIFIDEVNLANMTGIIEKNLESAVSIYPNPSADGNFVVANAFNSTNMTITNILGDVITDYSTETDNQGNIRVNLNNNAAGLYLVRITDVEGRTQVAKVNVSK